MDLVEVEAVIAAHPAVAQAVAHTWPGHRGEHQLPGITTSK